VWGLVFFFGNAFIRLFEKFSSPMSSPPPPAPTPKGPPRVLIMGARGGHLDACRPPRIDRARSRPDGRAATCSARRTSRRSRSTLSAKRRSEETRSDSTRALEAATAVSRSSRNDGSSVSASSVRKYFGGEKKKKKKKKDKDFFFFFFFFFCCCKRQSGRAALSIFTDK
jgi:hypothetical protein